MRVGIVILPEARWGEAAGWWRDAEAMGFDHAWTYDHLGWRTLVDHPWFDAMTTLAAAATVTEHIPLGTLVSSPNTRRIPSFVREIITVDDVSGGRFRLGLGSGGTGNYDNAVFGAAELTRRERAARFAEFVAGLDAALTEPVADVDGDHVTAREVRSIPGCVQQPRVPFVIGALGPKAMRLAADHGQAWVTTGWGGATDAEYWTGLADLVDRFGHVCADADRPWDSIDRILLLDAASPTFSLESPATADDHLGRAQDLGFTDAIIHRPRQEGIYQGDLSVLEHVASDVLPAIKRGPSGQ